MPPLRLFRHPLHSNLPFESFLALIMGPGKPVTVIKGYANKINFCLTCSWFPLINPTLSMLLWPQLDESPWSDEEVRGLPLWSPCGWAIEQHLPGLRSMPLPHWLRWSRHMLKGIIRIAVPKGNSWLLSSVDDTDDPPPTRLRAGAPTQCGGLTNSDCRLIASSKIMHHVSAAFALFCDLWRVFERLNRMKFV